MERLLISFAFLVFLLPIVLIALLVIFLLRRKGKGSHPTGITAAGLYRYVVAAVGLFVGLGGIQLLLKALLLALAPDNLILDRAAPNRLAIGISMVIVGAAVWAVHWSMAQRRMRQAPEEERTSPLRRLYLYGTLFAALCSAATGAVGLLRWGLGVTDYAGATGSIAGLVVWGALWLWHWQLASRERSGPLWSGVIPQLYLYLTAAWTFILLVSGVAFLVRHFFVFAYDALTHRSILIGGAPPIWSNGARTAVALALVGGVAWALHWLYFARGDRTSVGRAIFDFIAVLAGKLALLGAIFTAVANLLFWIFGTHTGSAATHFRVFPSALVAFSLGALVALAYHLDFERGAGQVENRRTGSRSAFAAIFAFIGLVSLATGLAFLVALPLGLLDSGALLSGRVWWRNALAGGLTAFGLGSVLWFINWRPLQPSTVRTGHRLWATYVYLVLGLATVALVSSATHLLFVLIRAVIDSTVTESWLDSGKWSLATVVAVAPILLYHWRVLRELREATPAPVPASVVAGALATVAFTSLGSTAAARALADALEGVAHVSLQTLGETELGRYSVTELPRLVADVRAHAGEPLGILLEGDSIRLFTTGARQVQH